MLKKIKQNLLLKVLSLNFISAAVSFFLGFFSIKIVSIFLGTSGMAFLGIFRNFSSMIKSITTLGINNSLVKLLVENRENKEELSKIYATFFWVFLFLSVFIGLLIFVFSSFISVLLFLSDSYIIPIRFLALILPFIVINTFWIATYNSLERIKRIVIIQIISNIFVFLFTVFLIWSKGIYGGVLSIVLGELIMVMITFLFVLKDKAYFKFTLHKIINKKYFKAIQKFSVMALLSAFIIPVTLLLIRNNIINTHSVQDAGIWDAVNRISAFYMLIFSSGLSLYYIPKLSSLKNDEDFKIELISYFKVFVPLFCVMLMTIFLLRSFILDFVLTKEFYPIKEVLIWQLLGDFFKIMTLAFGFQILVRARVRQYFILEIVFNLSYLLLSFYFVKNFSFEGALKAYFYANLILFILILFIFRKMFTGSKHSNISGQFSHNHVPFQ
jgi:PST family polysaccharide transporter